MRFFSFLSFLFLAYVFPLGARAHEVYVLSEETIASSLAAERFSLVSVITDNLGNFAFWGLLGLVLVVAVFFLSISRPIEDWLDPYLAKLPTFAPLIGRITVSLALFASAYYQALFGPELPFSALFGAYSPLITASLVIAGFMLIVGWHTRKAAVAMLFLFGYAVLMNGVYMVTYANYFGEFLLLTILGAHVFAIHHKEHDNKHLPAFLIKLKNRLTPFAFLFLRIAFGSALIYASLWAKVLHNNLALAVASTPLAGHMVSLAATFGFEPHFMVLGAAIVEVAIGLFFIFGIEIRFTSLFLLFWLTLSLIYFGEVVWPHLILIGIPLSFIFYGYDKYSLEGYFFKRDGREPVL